MRAKESKMELKIVENEVWERKGRSLALFKERISTSFEAIGWASSFLAFGWVKGTNSNQFCNFPCLACDFRRVGPPCCAQGFKFQNLNWVDSTRVILGRHTRRACQVWAFWLLGLQFTRAKGEWRLMGLGFYSALGRVTWPSGLMGFCLETLLGPSQTSGLAEYG